MVLKPVTTRLIVAGSLRRRKEDVGDVEILYVPMIQHGVDPEDLFRERQVTTNMAEVAIERLLGNGTLEKRNTSLGRTLFGPENKCVRHVATGIPVDLFATKEARWWNYLVCRTGPKELNERIARKAQDLGWQWNPYSPGFWAAGLCCEMKSEQDVFRFVGLPYMEPWERE